MFVLYSRGSDSESSGASEEISAKKNEALQGVKFARETLTALK